MLVLTRKVSEMIHIGDDIVIKVIRTGKTTVKIGVEAPSNVRVLRAELCEESAETEDAASAPSQSMQHKVMQPAAMRALPKPYPHVA